MILVDKCTEEFSVDVRIHQRRITGISRMFKIRRQGKNDSRLSLYESEREGISRLPDCTKVTILKSKMNKR
jgi:hypothetical protein